MARNDRIGIVYELLKAGKSGPEICRELKMSPSALSRVLGAKRMYKYEILERDTVSMMRKTISLLHAMPVYDRLTSLATAEGETGRKACVDLLEQFNTAFPPMRPMRKSFFD